MSTLVSNIIKPRSGDTVTFSNSNISATDGTFSGNVSISGTVTYEDVTSVDSVGIVTARTGVRVTDGGLVVNAGVSTLGVVDVTSGVRVTNGGLVVNAGVSTLGVVTGATYYGDGSNLTGIEAGSANFVASGIIPNGSTVVINTDGTVGVITQTGSPTPSFGTPVVFESASSPYVSSAYDSTNGKVVIAYRDDGNSSYGTAIVGTISGDAITFGTAAVFESATSDFISIAYDSTNERVVIAYSDHGNSEYGTAVVGTVSGTSISFGTPVVFESAKILAVSIAYDSTNGKVVVAYSDDGNSNYGTAVVGTVSGTSISFGTPVVFESAACGGITSVVYDITNDRVVISYKDNGNSNYGTAIVGSVSGTSISFGSAAVFDGAIDYLSSTYDSTNGKIIMAYQDNDNSNYGTAVVGTVSGTSISFGTPVVFESAVTNHNSVAHDSTNDKVVISYRDQGNSNYGTAIVGTVSGTSISFGTPVVFESATVDYTSSTYDSTNNRVLISYRDSGNLDYGTSVVFRATSQSSNLTAENYIGIAAESISNAATGKINIVGGVNSSQSGLTTAKTYYVAPTGILTTTAGNPSVVAGTSISDTKILVR